MKKHCSLLYEPLQVPACLHVCVCVCVLCVFFSLLALRPARCHSARSFITAVTWSEPGSIGLPVTDTSSDLQPMPILPPTLHTHTHTHTHTYTYTHPTHIHIYTHTDTETHTCRHIPTTAYSCKPPYPSASHLSLPFPPQNPIFLSV